MGAAADAVVEAVREAGLRYVLDERPGFSRREQRGGFAYLDASGAVVTDEATLDRIRRLAIPPAWTDVWIAPSANAHLQATGRDARGRKQYRYHERFRLARDETKFGQLAAFGRVLPRIRKRVEADLALPGLPREKVLATVVRLLERTAIRIGNDEYARLNGSFGAATLRNEHVAVSGTTLSFRFRGKGGKDHALDVRDPALARIVRRLQDLPGQELFEYPLPDGSMHVVGSAEVNDYLGAISGTDITAKYFRTWDATLAAFVALRDAEPAESATARTRAANEAIRAAASRLSNTFAVCRKSYVHPAVIEAYLADTLASPDRVRTVRGLTADESQLVAFLDRLTAATRAA